MSFCNKDKQPVLIKDLFHGASCFLILGGKSLLDNDLSLLRHPSIVTMGVNNSPATFRPNLWTMVDDVKNFIKSIYDDAGIIKFLPQPKNTHMLWDNMKWCQSKTRVRDCPGVIYYERNDTDKHPFDPDTFFTCPKFCWGNHERRCECGWMRPDKTIRCNCGHKKFRRNKCVKCGWKKPKRITECEKCGEKDMWGCRSVMLVAIRILYDLGFKRVYLLGADFKMVQGEENYNFKQDRSNQSIKNNNNSYRRLNIRFDKLRPIMEDGGMLVYNCNPNSGLKSFEFKRFGDAIKEALSHIPIEENTNGLYDRKANEKAAAKAKEKAVEHVREDVQLTMEEFARRLK